MGVVQAITGYTTLLFGMSSVHCTEKCVTAGNDHPKYRTERSKLGNDNISVDYKYIAGIVCAEIHY